jgi:2-polyprenyl-3-methyl-5-hydroxy-6-metoxy-1,4-benzoquinol methylase
MDTPANPRALPSVYPFRLEINYSLGRLEQAADPALETLLRQAYIIGNEMGTPSENTSLGRPYVEDFMRFIDRLSPHRGALLEIGAGTGFLSKCLAETGWQVTSIEPGLGYRSNWEANGVEVVNDFFPSERVLGQFDAIIFYTVLEHIKDTTSFLNKVKLQLKAGGRVFLAVPDCTAEIAVGDPSILLHEHYQYFTANSLTKTLSEAGFSATVQVGQFGRSLFAMGEISESRVQSDVTRDCIFELEDYVFRVSAAREVVREAIERWRQIGSLGIYCPSRLLNFLPVTDDLIFYDDALGLQGKYYPPFESPIRDRASLLENPPATLLIGSRTFGVRIKSDLTAMGLKSNIAFLGDLL